MKIKILVLVVLVSGLGFGCFAFADDFLNREQFFSSYVDAVTKDVSLSEAYKHTLLKYRGLQKDTAIYQTMQKAVYYDLFPNGRILLPLKKTVTEKQVCSIISRKFTIDASCAESMGITSDRLNEVLFQVQDIQKVQTTPLPLQLTNEGYLDDTMLNQINDKLNSSSHGPGNKDMIYTTIQNVIDSVKDPYTVFFPPTEAKQFNEEMEGEFEGIGAYVDMLKPGELMITAPIMGSPAEKAGLMAGDRILKVDDHRINKKIDTTTVVTWIKGPAGTEVKLLILRKKKILTFTLTREAVVVKNVAAKTYSGKVCYMSIGMFGYGVYNEFSTAMTKVFGRNKCEKYVFDVRNNPGGSLDEVSSILNYFVPTGEATVVVNSRFGEESLVSNDLVNGSKITNRKVAVLINQGSASASEIFAGTIRDYLPYATLIGDTSYGKGSVQELLQYEDGSMLKHTIAKWYTGKSKTTIDHVGISPDVKISDDPKTAEDEQLQAALE